MPSSDRSKEPNDHEVRQLLSIAQDAVEIASRVILSDVPLTLTEKGDRDLTSNVDVMAEEAVRDYLRSRTPELRLLAEEAGGTMPATDELCWVLDPIDGTVNFLHGVPLCAVSLSLLRDKTAIAAVIRLPFLGNQYYAIHAHGSYVDGKRLNVSTTASLNKALVSIDQYTFGEMSERNNRIRLRLTEQLAARAQRVRMLGASAIDLAWTAQGKLDACVLFGNKSWDTSAGVLIAREAGARVLDQCGSEHSASSSATIAVTPKLEQELLGLVATVIEEAG